MAISFWLSQETLQPFWGIVNLQSSGSGQVGPLHNAAEFGHLHSQVMNNAVILTRNLSTKKMVLLKCTASRFKTYGSTFPPIVVD